MPLSAIAFFPANPRAFYHLTNVLGSIFEPYALNDKAQPPTGDFGDGSWLFNPAAPWSVQPCVRL
jgi:hypothetical protein